MEETRAISHLAQRHLAELAPSPTNGITRTVFRLVLQEQLSLNGPPSAGPRAAVMTHRQGWLLQEPMRYRLMPRARLIAGLPPGQPVAGK